MLSRALLTYSRCPCGAKLSDYEMQNHKLLDNLCEECYNESMGSVYDDFDDEGFMDKDDD